MNTQNMLIIAIIAANCSIATFASTEPSINRPSIFDQMARVRYGLPLDRKKTPTSPDIIEHRFSGKSYYEIITTLPFPKHFRQKRIYYGKNDDGKTCYRRISEHEINPEFGNVNLVLFHEAAPYNPWSEDSFEHIGTYSDINAQNRVVHSMASKGGVWCPEQNTIIGGSREIGQNEEQECICNQYVAALAKAANDPQPSKIFKK